MPDAKPQDHGVCPECGSWLLIAYRYGITGTFVGCEVRCPCCMWFERYPFTAGVASQTTGNAGYLAQESPRAPN